MRYKRLNLIMLFFALLFIVVSCKEDAIEPSLFGSIKGQVLDQDTNMPISNAAITTSPPTSSIITDSNGEFRLSNIPTGSYNITAKKKDYTSSTISVSVTEATETNAVIFLGKDEGGSVATPVDPLPANQSADQEVNLTLSWGLDETTTDSLTYDIYLYANGSLQQERVAENLEDTSYAVENLRYNTTYFWQVVAKNQDSTKSNSEIWSFKTKSFPNYPYLFSSDIDGDYEIYMANDEGEIVQLTFNSSKELWPQYISKTNSVVYVSDRDLENHIYSQQLNTNEAVKLTNVPIASNNNVGFGFDVSPDENYIIYGNYEKLYRINTDGRGLKQIATAPEGRNFREVSYSDQGDKIVALLIGTAPYTSEIYTLNSDGTNLSMFMDDVPGSLGSPSFSIDGTHIMFTQDLSGNEVLDGKQLNSNIFIMAVDKSDTTNVSIGKDEGTNDLFPRFSPDGGNVIFMNGSNASNKTEIMKVNLTGESREVIYSDGKYPYWK